MAFGQVSGPPASYKQVQALEELLEQADFGSFREARHRFGLTQRQANGKFTSDEAVDLIDRLTAAIGDGTAVVEADDDVAPSTHDRAAERRARERDELLAGVEAGAMADELTRRGWLCMAPPG